MEGGWGEGVGEEKLGELALAEGHEIRLGDVSILQYRESENVKKAFLPLWKIPNRIASAGIVQGTSNSR